MNREELKELKYKFETDSIENVYNHIIKLILPGVLHELNNSHAIIDGYLQFLTGKIVVPEEQKEKIGDKINKSSKDLTLMLRALTSLLSQLKIEFPTSTSTILDAIKYSLKIQIYKKLKIESEYICENEVVINIKIGDIISSMLLLILSILSDVEEGGKFTFLIKIVDSKLIFNLLFEKLSDFNIEEYGKLLEFVKNIFQESNGKFRYKKDGNVSLNFEFIFSNEK